MRRMVGRWPSDVGISQHLATNLLDTGFVDLIRGLLDQYGFLPTHSFWRSPRPSIIADFEQSAAGKYSSCEI